MTQHARTPLRHRALHFRMWRILREFPNASDHELSRELGVSLPTLIVIRDEFDMGRSQRRGGAQDHVRQGAAQRDVFSYMENPAHNHYLPTTEERA